MDQFNPGAVTTLTPEQRAKHLKTIEKIENLPRPEKWREIKKFTLELKPWLKQAEKEHAEACKELRQNTSSTTASSKSGAMRNTMKLFNPVYQSMIKLDPDLLDEMSGKNKGLQGKVSHDLWKAFPEYRICREY